MSSNLCLKSETRLSQSGNVLMLVRVLEGEKLLSEVLMTPEDFSSLILGAQRTVVNTVTTCRIGELPSNIQYFDGYVTDEQGTFGGIFYLPPQKHQFLLNHDGKTECFYIPMPGLVYSLAFNKGAKKSMRCFAYRKWEGQDTALFQYPFGNVSASGDVCMGSITGRVVSFSDMGEYIEASLDGVTNSDYLSNDMVRLSCDKNQHEFCKEIQEFEEFPTELLMEAKLKNVNDLRSMFFVENRVR